MPFSRDPNNYPQMFYQLIEAFKTNDKIILSSSEKKDSESVRLQFYAFIRALEYDAAKLRKRGGNENIFLATQQEGKARLARSRLAEVYLDLENSQWILSFIKRDLAKRVNGFAQQISSILEDETPTGRGEALPAFLNFLTPEGSVVDEKLPTSLYTTEGTKDALAIEEVQPIDIARAQANLAGKKFDEEEWRSKEERRLDYIKKMTQFGKDEEK